MNRVRERVRIRVRVSEHAIKQFKNRIIMNEHFENSKVIEQVKSLFSQARYVSDNGNGILFRNEDLMIEFIVKNGCIVTLFPVGKKGVK